MAKFIITFGQQHTHRINNFTFDKDSVAIIKAETYSEARDVAFDLFNDVFHQCIREEEFDEKGLIEYFPRGKYPANYGVIERNGYI